MALGSIIGDRYKVIEPLGSGGFSQTFLAQDQHLPGFPLCVIKQLKPLATDPKGLHLARRLFDSEAQLLQQLGTHDQIPRLMAHFQEDQDFYLVQEFIDGHPLSQELIPGKQWDDQYVISLFQSILKPLVFVHQHNVIHRDLKPANIMRRKQDQALVLIDFGAVKQIGGQPVDDLGQTKFTVAIGTPGYMPSEQGKGMPRLSSDIYALGMIGIQALTGVRPENLPEDMETGELIWRDRANLQSPALGDLLDQMIRYDFRQRQRSAMAVAEALEHLLRVADLTPTVADPAFPGDQNAVTIADAAALVPTFNQGAQPTLPLDQAGEIVPALALTAQPTLPPSQTEERSATVSQPPITQPPITQPRWSFQPWRHLGGVLRRRRALAGLGVAAIAATGLAGYLYLRGFRTGTGKLLDAAQELALMSPGTCHPTIRVVADPDPPLNIRKGPGTQFKVVKTLKNGEYVVIVNERDGWVQINSPAPGWIAEGRTKPYCKSTQ